ncbi:phage tail tape measure protein [Rhodoplanes azumiensis]|uniref:Phage tail tape measure protein n=1 Tax=Rhodoplanes azumiensis TaxID=1897628 RepID=A0ABW5AK41_9BRAD
MAGRSAEITIRLRDLASAGAKQIAAALKQVGTAARSVNGTTVRGPHVAGQGAPGTLVAPGLGLKGLAATAGAYGLGRSVTRGFRDYADVERHLTRVMNTANATRAEMGGVLGDLVKLSNEVALPLNDVVGGLDTLVAQGRTLKDALAILPAVARSAQASGATVEDIAKSADATASHMKVGAEGMQQAFDTMVAGGKAGMFELKDMARYLPSILPAASAAGLKGQEGLRTIVALMQVVRKFSGTSEEAAASVSDLFQKMEMAETQKKFKELGVDLEAMFKKGRQEGRNLLEVFEEAVHLATKGDASLVPKLAQDKEFARAIRSMIQARGEWQKLAREIAATSPGSTVKDLSNVTNDAAAATQRLNSAWESLLRSAGRLADKLGASSVMQGIANETNRLVDSWTDHPWSGTDAARAKAQEQALKLAEVRAKQAEMAVRTEEGRVAGAEKDAAAGRPFGRSNLKAAQERLAAARIAHQEAQMRVETMRLLRDKLPVTVTEQDRRSREQQDDHLRFWGPEKKRRAEEERARSEREAQKQLWDRRTGRVGPKTSAAPPVVDMGDAPGKLDQITQRAGQAGQALDKVDGARVAPVVDTSSIDAAISKVQQLLGGLMKASGMVVSPTITPRIAPASGGAAGTLNDFPGRR